MLPEKRIREMYSKNRERIIQHIQTEHGFFVVDFYNNSDVRINDYRDAKAEFYMNIPRSISPEILDAVFAESLDSYLKYGINREYDKIICG